MSFGEDFLVAYFYIFLVLLGRNFGHDTFRLWYFRPRFCTIRLYWAGATWANEMNFVMNYAQQSSMLPLCYGCPLDTLVRILGILVMILVDTLVMILVDILVMILGGYFGHDTWTLWS